MYVLIKLSPAARFNINKIAYHIVEFCKVYNVTSFIYSDSALDHSVLFNVEYFNINDAMRYNALHLGTSDDSINAIINSAANDIVVMSKCYIDMLGKVLASRKKMYYVIHLTANVKVATLSSITLLDRINDQSNCDIVNRAAAPMFILPVLQPPPEAQVNLQSLPENIMRIYNNSRFAMPHGNPNVIIIYHQNSINEITRCVNLTAPSLSILPDQVKVVSKPEVKIPFEDIDFDYHRVAIIDITSNQSDVLCPNVSFINHIACSTGFTVRRQNSYHDYRYKWQGVIIVATQDKKVIDCMNLHINCINFHI